MYRTCLPALAAAMLLGCEASQPAARIERSTAAPARSSSAPAASSRAVTLQVKGYEGIQDLVESHRGKVVVMDAWSTWCGPCIKEFPGLVRLHEKYGPDKLAAISLSFDFEGLGGEKPQDHEEKVLAFLRDQRATFDNVISSVPSEELYQKLGIPTVPAVFVYDQQGQLVKRFENTDPQAADYTYKDVEALVVELLGESG